MTTNHNRLKKGCRIVFAGILSIALFCEGPAAVAAAKSKDTVVEENTAASFAEDEKENSSADTSKKKDKAEKSGKGTVTTDVEQVSDGENEEAPIKREETKRKGTTGVEKDSAEASKKKDTAKDTAKDPVTDASKDSGKDTSKDSEKDTAKDSAEKKKKSETELTEKIVTISGSRIKVDSLHGVAALYRSGVSSSTDGSNATYSCAAFVKKYYSKIYGLELNNMYPGSVPNVVNGSDYFVAVKKPKIGDIVSLPGHWAIVKAVSGDQVVLIEQNYKWSQNGGYACRVNRRISKSAAVYYRLHSLTKA